MKGKSTIAIRIGENHREFQHGDVVVPIHLSTTFGKESITEIEKGYVYSRTSNPTRTVLEKKLAALEKGKYALAFSSGMAAITSVLLSLLKKGDHIVAFDDLYGGTRRLFEKVFNRYGLKVSYVDARFTSKVIEAIRQDTKMIWLETPTNPLMKLADIKEIASIARENNVLTIVDNTFATPIFQNPLELGADIVVHSVTKYIGGHSDVVGGAVIVNKRELYEKISFVQNAAGAILSPFDSWLVIRGIKTLEIRMKRHEENAMAIAEFLENHEKIKKVLYPGLKTHPQYPLAKKQMKGYGGMLSFELKGTGKNAIKFVECLKLFTLAESLGGVESLIEIPAMMTHASIPEEEREKIGITNTLVRMSVGIENKEDLLEDINRCLNTL